MGPGIGLRARGEEMAGLEAVMGFKVYGMGAAPWLLALAAWTAGLSGLLVRAEFGGLRPRAARLWLDMRGAGGAL